MIRVRQTVFNDQPRRGYLSDGFDRGDGELGTAPTGQRWYAQGGFYTASIVSGRIQLPNGAIGQRAAYPAIDLGAFPKKMGGSFSFTGAQGDPDSVVLICSNGQGGQLNGGIAWANMVHFVTSPLGWYLNFYETKTSSASIASGGHSLSTNGTIYSVAIAFDIPNNQATITLPSGSTQTLTDSRFASLGGEHLIWELYLDDATPTAFPRWESVYAWI